MALSPNVIEESFNEAKKCKLEGKITSFVAKYKDECISDLKINVQNEKGMFTIYGNQINTPEGCGIEATFPLIDINNNITYPKVGDNIFSILDSKNNAILKIGRDSYYSNSGIIDCSGSIIQETNKNIKIPKETIENIKTINKTTFENNNYIFFGIIAFLIIVVLLLSYKLYKSKK